MFLEAPCIYKDLLQGSCLIISLTTASSGPRLCCRSFSPWLVLVLLVQENCHAQGVVVNWRSVIKDRETIRSEEEDVPGVNVHAETRTTCAPCGCDGIVFYRDTHANKS